VEKMKVQSKTIRPMLWAMDACPACQSKKLLPDYSTGEVFCNCCGL